MTKLRYRAIQQSRNAINLSQIGGHKKRPCAVTCLMVSVVQRLMPAMSQPACASPNAIPGPAWYHNQ